MPVLLPPAVTMSLLRLILAGPEDLFRWRWFGMPCGRVSDTGGESGGGLGDDVGFTVTAVKPSDCKTES
jgi:hypothetical protein